MLTNERLQPKFKVLINSIDRTHDVLDVQVDIQENLLSTCTLKLAKGLIYLDTIKVDYQVVVYGGTLDQSNYIKLFVGNVHYVRPNFTSNGIVNVTYISFSSNTALKKDIDRVLFYPSKNSPRAWANVDQILLSTIIRKIVSELGMSFGKFNNVEALLLPQDPYITHTATIKQNLPDWGFLRMLAKKFSCKMWEELDPTDGKYKFYFLDATLVGGDVDNDTTFVYIPRDADKTYATPTLRAGQTQLMSFSANEDSAARTRNLRTVSIFDKAGNKQEVSITYDTKTDKLFYYKPNWERFNKLSAEEQADLEKLIYNEQFLHEGVDFYYDKIEITKEQRGSVDWFTVNGRPDMGIAATIEFAGNVHIKPYRYYRILGVSERYSSDPDGNEGTWYMKSVVHKFANSGYKISAKLYR